MDLSNDHTDTLSDTSSQDFEYLASEFRVRPISDDKQDVFVLRDIVKQENTFQGMINALQEKTQLSRPSRNTDSTYRSCQNMLLAAEVLEWSEDMNNEMKKFLKDPWIKKSIKDWQWKLARGEDRPALGISRPLPGGMSMNTFKQFIGYYDTVRFTFNTGVLVGLRLVLGPDSQA